MVKRYVSQYSNATQGCNARKAISVVYEFLYCSVLSLGSNLNPRIGVQQPDMGSIFQIKNQLNILVIGIYNINAFFIYSTMRPNKHTSWINVFTDLVLRRSNFSIVPPSSNTERTLMYLLLFTNSAQRELVSICTQTIHNRNWLSLHYTIDATWVHMRSSSTNRT